MCEPNIEMDRFSVGWSDCESEWVDSGSERESDVDEAEASEDAEQMREEPMGNHEKDARRVLTRSETHETLGSTAPASPENREMLIYMRWPPSKTASPKAATYSKKERQALADEAKKRANEMCMQMLVKNLARRNKHRYFDFSGESESEAAKQRIDRRKAVCCEANSFDESYAGAQEVLQGRLTFRAPRRSNTVSIGEVVRALSPLVA